MDVDRTLPAVAVLTDGALTSRIVGLEAAVIGHDVASATELAAAGQLGSDTFLGALILKETAAQIDNLVHATGIMTALPWVTDPGEKIKYVSLAAGSGSRLYDLSTNRQIGEFKFSRWGPPGKNAVREGLLFADVVELAEAETSLKRRLYLLGAATQLQFLGSGRGLDSVCAKQQPTLGRLRTKYGDHYHTVGQYWAAMCHRIEVVDLTEVVPQLGRTAPSPPLSATSITLAEVRMKWPDARLSWHGGWSVAWAVTSESQPALVVAGSTGDEAAILVFAHPAHREHYAVSQGWRPVT